MTYTVIAEGLVKSFGSRPVLDGVDLAVPTGSVLALLGANGAGKSTLVRILSTLLTPDGGHATIAGHDLRRDPAAVRAAISLTGQHASVDDVLTGRENLEMIGRLRHLSRRAARARADALLREFGLHGAAGRRVSTYSGGMRRRLDLAAGMVRRPVLAFLDEPTTGLDPRSREQLWTAVRAMVSDGVTVLLTTQYLDEADALADAVAVLDGGRVVAQGTAGELKRQLHAETVRLTFDEPARYARARALLVTAACDDDAHTLEVATDGSADAVYELLGRLTHDDAGAATVSVQRPTLDEVFLSLTTPEPMEVM